MNVSHKYKLIWFAPPRVATRALSEILCHYDFFDATIGKHANIKSFPHTHTCKVPEGLEHYDIILQTRNPYSRIVSSWHLQCFNSPDNIQLIVDISFNDYILNKKWNYGDHYEKGLIKPPKYIVKYEKLVEDTLKLDFVDFNNPEIKQAFNRFIANNGYTNEGPHNQTGALPRDNKNTNYANWRSFYTEELAEIVYQTYQNQFTIFGYEKDSWKNESLST